MNAPGKINIPSRVNVNDAARAAMAGVTSYREGADRLLAMAKDNPALLSAIMEPYEMSACLDAVQKAVSDFRRRTWVAPDRAAQRERAEALADSNRETLMDFPLPGGMALRYATKDAVQQAAAFYETHAGDMAHKARWLGKVAARLTGIKTVGDTLTDAQLEKLQRETEHG